jgi:hypothetical protein
MEEANTQMRLLEALKKEFRLTRILWRQIFDQVTSFYEEQFYKTTANTKYKLL